jgi:D-3-phosphoglycerate dehydrogenase
MMMDSRLNILITEPDRYSPKALEIYQSLGHVDTGPITREELLQQIDTYDVAVIRLGHKFDAELLSEAVNLKAIVTPTTGLDHVDLKFSANKGIAVLSLKGETTFLRSIPSTAELTWGILLSLIRNIPQAINSVKSGVWDRDLFRGHELAGKTLGILGLGRIGEKIARYGLAFGMRVIAYDPFCEEWQSGVDRTESMKALLKQSDILSIHVPLEKETTNLLGEDELNMLPDGAIVVNTSRGAVINEKALLKALDSGKIASAAVDVICDEHLIPKQSSNMITYAQTHSNLLITPHIGGASFESMSATEIFMANKLRDFVLNKG